MAGDQQHNLSIIVSTVSHVVVGVWLRWLDHKAEE